MHQGAGWVGCGIVTAIPGPGWVAAFGLPIGLFFLKTGYFMWSEHLSGATCAFNHQTMNRSIALISLAGAVLLSGGCTTPQAARWEYKIAVRPQVLFNPLVSPGTNAPSRAELEKRIEENIRQGRERTESLLNELGKDGWVLINENEGLFYFKRPLK
jgi:hypothetical protein